MNGLSLWVCVTTVALLLWLWQGLRRVERLGRLPADLPGEPPKVSVIVSALNEQDTIEPALRSLLALDYPRLEVIALNDRSTDATGAILDRIAADDARLHVIHIAQLPEGWLGKNHALHVGAQCATGDFLLFTDADVVFERRALRQAVAHCVRHDLDHLGVMPEFTCRSTFLAALLAGTTLFLYAMHPLWRVRHSRRAFFGTGAFNMVRTTAYRSAGGHEPLRLEVIDDIMLGRMMNDRGFRQDALIGTASVMVEWYADAGALMRGLEKNSFANFHYSVPRAAAMVSMMLVGRYWPLLGLVVTRGPAWWFNLVAALADIALNLLVIRTTRWPLRSLLWWPVSSAFMAFVLVRGVVLTLRRGGVDWRGTLYALDDLKRAHGA